MAKPGPAVGKVDGLAELMTYYCECAAGYSSDLAYQDESYLNALVRMFEEALKVTVQLPAGEYKAMVARLNRARVVSHNIGYGVGDSMDYLVMRYTRG